MREWMEAIGVGILAAVALAGSCDSTRGNQGQPAPAADTVLNDDDLKVPFEPGVEHALYHPEPDEKAPSSSVVVSRAERPLHLGDKGKMAACKCTAVTASRCAPAHGARLSTLVPSPDPN